MKIVLPDCKTITRGAISLDVFKKYGEVSYYELSKNEELPERFRDAEAIFCNKTLLNAETLKYAPNLKYIGLFATGYNNVDLEYAKSKGIRVCNAGSYSTEAVAQHTFALILNHFCQVSKYEKYVNYGNYIKSDTFSPFIYPMNELSGKTIGLIGYGSIGRQVARIANAFNMNVIVYTRTPKDDAKCVELDELLSNSDIISVHCPLNEQSEKMFNADTFAKCKDGAFFVNTARGPIVDEMALKEAVESGKLSGAGLDVLEVEPMLDSNVLLGVENITITPHVAWAPITTRNRLLDIVIDNYENYLNGTPKNVIV